MFKERYLFGGIAAEVTFSYDYTKERCKDYITDKTPSVFITLNEDDIKYEADRTEQSQGLSKGYFEFLALYRKFCDMTAEKGIVLMHGCAVATGGKAYIFTAPSGTGKSTHASLWLKNFGEKVFILNGDKPLISTNGSEALVYGTPWDGKEHQSQNKCLPLGGIVLIERNDTNSITPIPSDEALKILLSQCHRPEKPQAMQHVLNGIIKLSDTVRFFKLKCNVSKEAALLSFNTLTKDDSNEV